MQNFQSLAILCACTAGFVSDLVGNHIIATRLLSQFQVHMEVSLGQLSRMLDTDHYVLVIHDQTQCKSW